MKKRRGGGKKKPLDAQVFDESRSRRIPCPDNVQMSVQQTLYGERADVLNALIKSAAATHVFLLVLRARGGAVIQSAASLVSHMR